jgi:hypothetical protein
MGNSPYFSNGKSNGESQTTKLRDLQGSAKPQPDQGQRTADSGAGGCASLEGRGTMEQK